MVLLALATTLALSSETFEGQSFHFGDPHVHTGASGDGGSDDVGGCDGDCGSVEDLVELALEEDLDWISVTDHINARWAQSEEDFAQVLEIQLEAHARGDLVTLPGAEVHFDLTTGGQLGHRNLMFFGTNGELEELTVSAMQFDGTSTSVDHCTDIFAWVKDLQDIYGPTLLIPHHPGTADPMPVDWTCHHPGFEPAVEVYSEHGNSMGAGTGFDPVWGRVWPEGQVHHALGMGLRLGFMGGSDRHDTHPGATCSVDTEHTHHPYGAGLTAVVLPEGETLDRDAIYTAMLQRRTYATSGPLLPATVQYTSGGAPVGTLGEDLHFPAGQPLEIEVAVPSKHSGHVVDVVAVTPAGEVPLLPSTTSTWATSMGIAPEWLYVRIEIDGATWYPKGCEDGGKDDREMIWMTPSWIQDGPGDLDGDGWTWARGDCHDGDPTVHAGATERCDSTLDHDCDGLAGTHDPDCLSLEEPDGPHLQGNPTGGLWDGPGDAPSESGLAPWGPSEDPATGCATTWPQGVILLPLVPLFVRRRRARS